MLSVRSSGGAGLSVAEKSVALVNTIHHWDALDLILAPESIRDHRKMLWTVNYPEL